MIGKLSIQHQPTKSFKPGVYQSRNKPLTNSGMGDKYYNNGLNRLYDTGRSHDKSRRYMRQNLNFRDKNDFRDNRN